MLSILFVDDEQDVIEGFKRMLFSQREIWKPYFSNTGQQAMNILENNSIDIIVSDMRMPEIDGAMLLSKVKKYYPKVLRFVLSGYQDEAKSIKASGVAHQFIAKPCNTETLMETIEKAYFLRNYINNPTLLEVVTGLGELPGVPDIYIEVEETLQDPDSTFETVEKILARDITLVAKILQIANSSFFGIHGRVTNLLQALSFLGVNIIKALVLHISTFSRLKVRPEQINFYQSVTTHSLDVANVSRRIIQTATNNRLLIDDTYMAGILHDIGKIVLLNYEDYIDRTMRAMSKMKVDFYEAEQELFGFTHCNAGAYLLGIWGLPDPIVEAAAFHHKPSDAINTIELSPLSVVHAANCFVAQNQVQQQDRTKGLELMPAIDFEYYEKLNLSNKLQQWQEISNE